MSQLRAVDVKEVLAWAGEALSKASGDLIKLDDAEILSNDSRRNFIARAVARYGNGGARSVILKPVRYLMARPMLRGKISFQSSCMLMTVQPLLLASS
jgi:hypothetical protein